MRSSNEASLPISTQETPLLPLLLHHDQQHYSSPPKQPRIKNFKAKISFTLRILIVLIVGFIIIYSIYTKNLNPKPPHNSYLSGLSKYYCHLTRHHKLCHQSMPSIITNVTALRPNPAHIFTASLQLVVNQLNHTTTAISKALSAPSSNNTTAYLSTCQALVNDSLSRLNRSLGFLGVDLFFGSFIPYLEEEDYNIRDEIKRVRNNIGKCLLGPVEIDGETTMVGVEEVKLEVVKAIKLADNFISLFDRRQAILDDFYNPYYIENEGYNYLYNYYFYFDSYGHSFDYFFLVCLFGVMYLFLGLLYFLFWQQ